MKPDSHTREALDREQALLQSIHCGQSQFILLVDSQSRRFAPSDLNEVFDDATALLDAFVEDTRAKVTRDQLPTVMGDRAHLVQLLESRFGNGVKYYGDELPRVRVSSERNGSEWIISVRDNVIGICRKHHERYLKSFVACTPRANIPVPELVWPFAITPKSPRPFTVVDGICFPRTPHVSIFALLPAIKPVRRHASARRAVLATLARA